MAAPDTTAQTVTLSETESKALVASYAVAFAAERICPDVDSAVAAAAALGHPVAVKLNGQGIAHKTERGLVRLGLRDDVAVRRAAEELLAAARPDDGEVSLLVAPMIRGNREFIAGMIRDPQFGPMVMLGVGGVLAEAIADVALRLVPITAADANDMIDDLATNYAGKAKIGTPEPPDPRSPASVMSDGSSLTWTVPKPCRSPGAMAWKPWGCRSASPNMLLRQMPVSPTTNPAFSPADVVTLA